MLSRLLAYLLAGIPASIGVAFVARYAYVTSDAAIDGAANAFLFGMIAAGAFAGPACAIAVVHNGRKIAGVILGLLSVLAMAANWSHTLGAIAHRGAGTEAVTVKAKADEKDARAELARIAAERGAMVFTPATGETVQGAREAVAAAERIRQRECGNGDPKQRGPNCRLRESEEQTKRDALAVVLSSKAATDKAAKIDADAAAIRTRLASTQPTKETNSLGEALGRLLPWLSAAQAATFQQGLVSAIAELLIAAALALPELLRSDRTARARTGEATAPPAEPSRSARPPNVVKVLGAVVQPADRKSRVEIADVLRAYVAACKAQGIEVASGEAFGLQAKAFAEAAGIRVLSSGGQVFWCGVRLVA